MNTENLDSDRTKYGYEPKKGTHAKEMEAQRIFSRQGMCAVSPRGAHFRPQFSWQRRLCTKARSVFTLGTDSRLRTVSYK